MTTLFDDIRKPVKKGNQWQCCSQAQMATGRVLMCSACGFGIMTSKKRLVFDLHPPRMMRTREAMTTAWQSWDEETRAVYKDWLELAKPYADNDEHAASWAFDRAQDFLHAKESGISTEQQYAAVLAGVRNDAARYETIYREVTV